MHYGSSNFSLRQTSVSSLILNRLRQGSSLNRARRTGCLHETAGISYYWESIQGYDVGTNENQSPKMRTAAEHTALEMD